MISGINPQLLQDIVNVALLLFVAISTWIINKINMHLKPDQRQRVQDFANMIVPAIEQTLPNLSGVDKKIRATTIIISLLESIGIKDVNPLLIDMAIESAVNAMNMIKSPPPAPPATPVAK